jgi:nucleotide-binding universal stress UspA family protein
MKAQSKGSPLHPIVSPRRRVSGALKRVLVTTDFSEASKQALPYAAVFGERFGAQLYLLHVVEPPPRFVGLESMTLLQSGDATVGHALGQLDSLADHVFGAGANVKTHVRPGQPLRVITKARATLTPTCSSWPLTVTAG